MHEFNRENDDDNDDDDDDEEEEEKRRRKKYQTQSGKMYKEQNTGGRIQGILVRLTTVGQTSMTQHVSFAYQGQRIIR